VNRRAHIEHAAVLAVVPAQAVFHFEFAARGEGIAKDFQAARHVVRMQALEPGAAVHFAAGPSGEVEPRLIVERALPRGVRHPQRDRGTIGHHAEDVRIRGLGNGPGDGQPRDLLFHVNRARGGERPSRARGGERPSRARGGKRPSRARGGKRQDAAWTVRETGPKNDGIVRNMRNKAATSCPAAKRKLDRTAFPCGDDFGFSLAMSTYCGRHLFDFPQNYSSVLCRTRLK
jgi:hypothetical protein